MKVYGIQFDPKWEQKDHNYQEVERMLGAEQIDENSLIVLPETFATGFSLNTEITSSDEPEKTTSFLRQLSIRYQSWTLGGIVERNNQRNYNRLICLSPNGQIIGNYYKIHLISQSGEDKVHTAGTQCKVFQIEAFTLCPIICYDLRFPELFRKGIDSGANLFVVIACWPDARIEHWKNLLKARAIENQAYVIGVNRTGNEPENLYSGNSMIFGPKGENISQLGKETGILKGHIEIEQVVKWRKDFPALEHRKI